MGLPRIDVSFDEIVSSVLKRSRNGSMAIILKVASGSGVSVFTKTSAVFGFSDENVEFIKMAFKAGVTKLIVAKQSGDIEEALETIDGMEWSWLAVPQADDTEKETVADYIKQARNNGKTYKVVLGDYENGDSEGIVNLANSFITSDIMDDEKEFTPEEYSVYIAGLLTGTALDESLTGYELGDVTNAEKRIDADADVDEGRLILIRNGDRFEIARAVTSLVLTNDTPSAFKKIKNVEGADLIKQDIARIFKSLYKGRKANNYANRQALCADIIAYFKGIEGEVLSGDFNNRAEPDAELTRQYLEDTGMDLSGKTDREVLLLNTGEKVFIKANICLLDAMEDIEMHITLN